LFIFEIDNAAYYDDFPWFCFLHLEKEGRKLVVAKKWILWRKRKKHPIIDKDHPVMVEMFAQDIIGGTLSTPVCALRLFTRLSLRMSWSLRLDGWQVLSPRKFCSRQPNLRI
jgi:hypothetical protein